MEENMKVMDLLEEIEDLVDEAPGLPLTGKIMIDAEEIFQIVREIRLALPDDIQQAKWIRDERDRILADAKTEYERIIAEAEKQADYLVETNEITQRAAKMGAQIRQDAEVNSKVLKLKTYDYVDKMLFDMQEQMDELNMKYFGEMYDNLEKSFNEINAILSSNREEMKTLAYKVQNENPELPDSAASSSNN